MSLLTLWETTSAGIILPYKILADNTLRRRQSHSFAPKTNAGLNIDKEGVGKLHFVAILNITPTFEKGRQILEGDWANQLSVTFKQTICFYQFSQVTTARGFLFGAKGDISRTSPTCG